MNDSEIGKKGKLINLTSASRAMNIKPDKEQIKKFDESAKQTSKLRIKLILGLVILMGLSIYLFSSGHWIFTSLTGIIALLLLFFISQINNTTVYESGLIVSALVVEINPLKIIVLADLRSTEEQEKVVFGCQKIKLENLPNHKIEIGEKVPCVSMFGLAVDGYRRHFEPRPISWGFKNSNYISEVVDFITNSNEYVNFKNEWGILEKLTNQMKEFDKENEVVFFDENLNKIQM